MITDTLRDLTAEDLEAAFALSQAVQWPHRLEDWRFFFSLGQGVAIERDGALIAVAMTWPYAPAAASIGLVIVSPQAQGGGLGRRLMTGLFDRLPDRATKLNATRAGLPLYEKLGYVAEGSVQQYQSADYAIPVESAAPGEALRALTLADRERLLGLDRQATGLDRARVIDACIAAGEGVVLERGGEVVGFSINRRFGRGWAVGPCAAPDLDGAKALCAHWLRAKPGEFVRFDAPEGSGLGEWLEGLGLAPVGAVATMTRGAFPKAAGPTRAFVLAGQALG